MKTKTIESFRQNLPVELKGRGWSIRKLARTSGLSATHISGYIRGKRGAMSETVERLAIALGHEVLVVPRRSDAEKRLENEGET